jgi:hypothetical protein
MVYDAFSCYFFYICPIDYQGDLIVHFTMIMPFHTSSYNRYTPQHIYQIPQPFSIKITHKYKYISSLLFPP